MMQLADFIEETITEIGRGVYKAKMNCAKWVAVAPGWINGVEQTETSHIEFDVSVVVTQTKTKSKSGSGNVGASISILSVAKANLTGNGDIKGSDERGTEFLQRVSFKVPVRMNANFRRTVPSSPEVGDSSNQ